MDLSVVPFYVWIGLCILLITLALSLFTITGAVCELLRVISDSWGRTKL